MSFPPETTHPESGGGLPELEQELRAHLTLCGELLAIVQREHQQLKTGKVDDLGALLQSREGMLERLNHIAAERKRPLIYGNTWIDDLVTLPIVKA